MGDLKGEAEHAGEAGAVRARVGQQQVGSGFRHLGNATGDRLKPQAQKEIVVRSQKHHPGILWEKLDSGH